MPTRAEVVAEARTWLRTPYHHLGHRKGVGADCVGLVTSLVVWCGQPINQRAWHYNRFAEAMDLDAEMEKHLQRVADCQPGDVMTFWIRDPGRPVHCGVATPNGLLHTHAGVRTVVEHGLDDWWRRRHVSTYRLPGVTD